MQSESNPATMEHSMARMLLADENGVTCGDCGSLQHPAVIASDWVGFICLMTSAFILIFKLMSFKGPEQDDKYYFGWVPACALPRLPP